MVDSAITMPTCKNQLKSISIPFVLVLLGGLLAGMPWIEELQIVGLGMIGFAFIWVFVKGTLK